MDNRKRMPIAMYLLSGFNGESFAASLVSYLLSAVLITPLCFLLLGRPSQDFTLDALPLFVFACVLVEFTLCKQLAAFQNKDKTTAWLILRLHRAVPSIAVRLMSWLLRTDLRAAAALMSWLLRTDLRAAAALMSRLLRTEPEAAAALMSRLRRTDLRAAEELMSWLLRTDLRAAAELMSRLLRTEPEEPT